MKNSLTMYFIGLWKVLRNLHGILLLHFKHLPEIFKDEAQEFWREEVVPKHVNGTEDGFNNAMKDLRVSLGGGAYAKDKTMNYLEDAEARTSEDATVQQHVRWIHHMITVANKSAGNESISPYRMKKTIYDYFSPQWIQDVSTKSMNKICLFIRNKVYVLLLRYKN